MSVIVSITMNESIDQVQAALKSVPTGALITGIHVRQPISTTGAVQEVTITFLEKPS